MSGHSEGPWTIEPGMNPGLLHVRNGDKMVCVCEQTHAKLIAAVPELLAACELFKLWMLEGQPRPWSDQVVFEQVKAAIKKAKGG
jgi:hypothetical protein